MWAIPHFITINFPKMPVNAAKKKQNRIVVMLFYL